MKKTISVNIKGINFIIEEDAYTLLESYLIKLTASLKNENDSKEIIDDIEYRISELCSLKITTNKQVVELEDIELILKTLGQPEEFLDEDDVSKADTNNENSETISVSKKLFRDVENGKVAGVCSGLASYFGVDVIFIRILFLLLFFTVGFSFPIYLIIWLVTPKANSSIDRLRMQGKNITINTVKEEVESTANRIKNESKSFANKLRKDGELSNKIYGLASMIRVFIGIGFIIFGCVSLVTMIFYGFFNKAFIPISRTVNMRFNSWDSHSDFLSLSDINELFIEDPSDFVWLKTFGFIFGLCLVLFSLILGVKLILNTKTKLVKLLLIVVFITGVVSIISCTYTVAKSGSQFAIEGEIERTIGNVNTAELVIETPTSLKKLNNEFVVKSDGFEGFLNIEGENIKNNKINFIYRSSKDSMYHISQRFSARSIVHKLAIEKAKHIQHKVDLKDNSLLIDTEFTYPKKDKLRGQNVTIIIEIPKGKNVRFSDQIISLENDFEEALEESFLEEEGVLFKNGVYEHWY